MNNKPFGVSLRRSWPDFVYTSTNVTKLPSLVNYNLLDVCFCKKYVLTCPKCLENMFELQITTHNEGVSVA